MKKFIPMVPPGGSSRIKCSNDGRNAHTHGAGREQTGVMQRMSGMFSRRGFNIDNITVGPTENLKYSRVTLAVNGDERLVEQVVNN